MKSLRRKGLACALIALVFASLCLAEAQAAQRANPFHKLKRGLINIIIAPLEIPLALGNPPQDLEPISGEAHGLLAGFSRFFVREVSGIFETATFLIPEYDEPFYPAKLGEPRLIDNPEL